MDFARGLVGVLVLLSIAFVFSTDRRAVKPRIIATGIGLQLVIAFILIRFEPVVNIYNWFAAGMTKLLGFSQSGGRFLFGNMIDDCCKEQGNGIMIPGEPRMMGRIQFDRFGQLSGIFKRDHVIIDR